MIHELAHLYLGDRGVSAAEIRATGGSSDPHEKWCNSVAAEFLFPETDVRSNSGI
ncbi:MAG: hypothetical protein WDO06_09350 [Actinomycetota bacterium]